MRERGVVVDELGGHDEVLRHAVGVLFRESAQLVARVAVELLAGDVLGNRRVVVPRAVVVAFRPTRTIRSGCARRPRAAVARAIAPRRTVALRRPAASSRSVTGGRAVSARGPIALRSTVATGRAVALWSTVATGCAVALRPVVAPRTIGAFSHG